MIRTPLALATTFASTLLLAGGCEKKAEDAVVDAAPAEPATQQAQIISADYDLGDEPLEAAHGGTIVALSVKGMTCNGCANSIGKTLTALDGVEGARVSLAKETAWVETNTTAGPKPGEMIAAVTQAGYETSLLEDADELPQSPLPAGDDPASAEG